MQGPLRVFTRYTHQGPPVGGIRHLLEDSLVLVTGWPKAQVESANEQEQADSHRIEQVCAAENDVLQPEPRRRDLADAHTRLSGLWQGAIVQQQNSRWRSSGRGEVTSTLTSCSIMWLKRSGS